MRDTTAQTRDRNKKKLYRVLNKKGIVPSEEKVERGEGILTLYFNSVKMAVQVRTLLITNRIAAEQYDVWVKVYLDAVEETQTYHQTLKRVA